MDTAELYRWVIIAALINASVFYAFTVIVFLAARKTNLNKALATQKAIWFLIISVLVLPAYIWGFNRIPLVIRMSLWVGLSIATWWVLWEVYHANWHVGYRLFFRHLWCKLSRRCRVENIKRET